MVPLTLQISPGTAVLHAVPPAVVEILQRFQHTPSVRLPLYEILQGLSGTYGEAPLLQELLPPASEHDNRHLNLVPE